MTVHPKHQITPEEYLASERTAEHKSEYFAGEMFAMGGASRAHNLIVLNIGSELRARLGPKSCETYPSDMRVKVDPSGLYTYPDVTVVCEEPRFEDEHVDTLLNPLVLFEVLSDSTEAYDRGQIFERYRRIESLQAYVLVAQDRAHVDLYQRSDEQWVLSEASGLEAGLRIDAVDCELPLAEIYAQVDLADAE